MKLSLNQILKELKYPLFLALVVILVIKFDSSFGDKHMTLEITSSAFTHNSKMPSKYTCDGENVSPPLTWGNAPAGTKSFAIIHDDPDAPRGDWVHWVVYNIPAEVTSVAENSVPRGSVEGATDYGTMSYDGACPPSGIHHYFFKIYALDIVLNLKEGATKAELLKAMEGHVLEQGKLIGLYQKK